MAEVLHTDGARDPRVGALLADLADADDVTLSVGNALWGDTGADFHDDYQGYVERTFDATVTEADLGTQPTADEIDAWVSERTEQRIPEIGPTWGCPQTTPSPCCSTRSTSWATGSSRSTKA